MTCRLALMVMILGAMAMVACGPQEPGTPEEAGDEGIHRTFERGPICVDMDVDRREITIAQRMTLSITATIDEAYQVELPSFGQQLEQFGIVDYHTTPSRLIEDGKTRITRSYVLEPFLSGEYAIPPMSLKFWKAGEDTSQVHEITTEEFSVRVASLLPEDMADLTIHDIQPPVELPSSHSLSLWLVSGACGGLVLFAAALVWRRRRQREDEVEAAVAAHETAYAELEQLIAEDLTGQGHIKRFHQRLSDILRRYIGNRFGIRAPEQTTEEFLAGLRPGIELSHEYAPLLGEFLGQCDLVKFAEHLPGADEVQRAFDTCKTFIAETAVASPPAAEETSNP